MAAFAFFLLMNALVFGGAALVARHALKFRDGLSLVMSSALVGWVAVVVGLEMLAAVDGIGPAPAALLAAAVFAAGSFCWFRDRMTEPQQGRDEQPPSAAGDATAHQGIVAQISFVLACVLVAWAMLDVLVTALCSPVLPVSDAPIYHLFFAARWWQSGTLEIVPTPFGDSAAPYFPANGDVWFTWLLLPWSSEIVAKVGQWPFLPLAMLAVYGLARELSVRREAAILSAVLWGTGTQQLLQSGMADVDVIMAAWLVVSTWFVVRFGRERRLAQLFCAGLAAGAALGTKYVAMLFVPWLVLATAVFAWKAPRRSIHLIALVASVAVPSAFWFVRNAWLTGNPVYPLHIEVFGLPVLKGWYARETLFTSRYHIPVNEWRWLLLLVLRGIDPILCVAWLAGVVAAAWAAVRGGWLAELLVGLACLHIVLFWVVNPYQTQDRFLFAGFAFLAVPVALVLDRWPPLSGPFVALLGLHLIVGPAALARLIFMWFGIDIGGQSFLLPPALSVFGRLRFVANPDLQGRVVLLAALSVSAALVVAAFRRCRIEVGRRQMMIVGLAGLVAAGGVACRTWLYRSVFPVRPLYFYPVAPQIGYTGGWLALEEASTRPMRVAYAGTNLPFYLFGQRLQNQVLYVNLNEHAVFRMHDYHRLFTSRGEPLAVNSTPDWDRREAEESAWLDNVRASRIELLFVGFTNAAGGEHNFYDADGFPIERTWADRHPEAFTLLHADSRTRLYSVRPR